MSNYGLLKNTLQNAVVWNNNNNEIEGPDVLACLITLINSLGVDFQFAGIAFPNTDPGSPDERVAYLAIKPGTYGNFNNLVLPDGNIGFFYYDGWWRRVVCPIPADESAAAMYAVARYFEFQYPLANIAIGLFKHGTGEIFSQSGSYRYSADFMPVYPGQVIKTTAIGTGTACIAVFYNSAREYIGDAQSAGSTFGTVTTITVPANARFMRVCSETGLSPVYFENVPQASPVSITALTGSLNDVWSILIDNVVFDYDINRNLQPGLFYYTDGHIFGDAASYQYCEDYFSVKPGQRLITNLYAVGSARAIAWYDRSKNYIGGEESLARESDIITVPDGAYLMRVCCERYIAGRYVRNTPIIDNTQSNGQNYFDNDASVDIVDAESKVFSPETPEIIHPYCGQVTPESRYIAFGFDDFRPTDFSWVAPLFSKYGFHATFNRINRDDRSLARQREIRNMVNSRHEIGEHSIMHEQYIWLSPLFNGQDPSSPDGSQVPFPSNSDLRSDRGDGKNVFGKTLTDTVSFDGSQSTWPVTGVTWANLTDAQCQLIRNCYSVIRDAEYGALLDALSNEFLGTTGTSLGSWNGTQYTGGIFTGCKTSANHEIWERVCLIEQRYYKKVFGLNQHFRTWSLPGAKNSRLYFESAGKYYFDSAMTQFANCLAAFTSSLLKDRTGAAKVRSWVDVLNDYGFWTVHDSDYPSRNDGNSLTQIARSLIINGHFSKRNSLVYPTLRTVKWWGYGSFTEAFFGGSKNYAQLMYEAQFNGSYDTNGFYQSIEDLRRFTAQGIIAGCVWDSNDLFEEKVYIESVLQYCRAAGIEVITKQEAVDICLRRSLTTGNIIYNPRLRNTAKEFLPDASNVPSNPDGYEGNCSVDTSGSAPVLIATGATYYKHYGVPTGCKLRYRAEIKGSSIISFYFLRNKAGFYNSEDVSVASRSISNADFAEFSLEFPVPDNPLEAWNGVTEDLGGKICALVIKYSAGLQVRNISLSVV